MGLLRIFAVVKQFGETNSIKWSAWKFWISYLYKMHFQNICCVETGRLVKVFPQGGEWNPPWHVWRNLGLKEVFALFRFVYQFLSSSSSSWIFPCMFHYIEKKSQLGCSDCVSSRKCKSETCFSLPVCCQAQICWEGKRTPLCVCLSGKLNSLLVFLSHDECLRFHSAALWGGGGEWEIGII